MKIFRVTAFLIFCSLVSHAQSDGDYRTRSSGGNWNTVSTWEVFNAGVWHNLEDAGAGSFQNVIPSSSSGVITVSPAHTLNIASGTITADQIVIAASNTSILDVNGGATLIINNGTGNDLTFQAGGFGGTVAGELRVNGTVVIDNNSTIGSPLANRLFVNGGGVYQHDYEDSAGVIYAATWADGSTLEFTGYTTNETVPSGLNQSFYNIIWNCTSKASPSGFFDFNGALGNATIRNNLEILSTNEEFLVFTQGTTYTLTIGNDLIVANNSAVAFNGFVSGVSSNITVNRNFEFNSSSFNASWLSVDGDLTLDIFGQFNVLGGTCDLINEGGFGAQTGSATVNVDGGVNIQGVLTNTVNSASFNFDGSGLRVFSNTGTTSGSINYSVNSGVILDLNVSPISGTGTFTVNNLSELRVGSTAAGGAIQSGTTAGNIRVSGTRTYNAGSTIVYNGSAAQFIGSGHPTIPNTTIDNANGVTLASNVTIGGALSLTSGNLTIGSNQLTLSGALSGTGSFSTVATSSLVFSGSGSIGALPFLSATPSIGTLTIDRSNEVAVLEDNITINTALNLAQGDLDIQGFVLNLPGTISGSGNIRSNDTSAINITGSGAFGTLQFDPSFSTVGAITYNRSGGSFTLSGTLTIDQALVLTNGGFTNSANLFMADGSTLTKNSNATFSGDNPETLGSDTYRVTYVNAGQTTGSEIPDELSTGALGDLTINTAGPVVLDQNLQVNGDVTLGSGSLSIGSNQLTVTGNWVRNGGSMAAYTGLVIFNGSSLINGSNAASFVNVEVAGGASLTLPSGNVNINGNLQIDPTATFNPNGGTVVLGTSNNQNLATGGASFNNIAVNKSSGTVTIASQLNLLGRLSFNGSSSATIASSGNLVVRSTSDGTSGNGSIGVVPAGASITGNVVVQRFMSGEGRIYRYLSSPVSGVSFEQWRDDFPITGTFDDPSTGPGITPGNPSLYRYVESNGGLADDGWEPWPTSGALGSYNIEVGRGYAAFIREGSASTVIDVTGPVNLANVSDISLNVTYNDDGNGPANEGWNLVGNPLPSSIDWDNILSGTGGTRVNVDQGIHVRDNGAGGIYRTWDGSTGDLANGLIATGQAFWVRANASSPSLSVNEQAKSGATASFYRTQNAAPEVIQIALSNGTITDNTFVSLSQDATFGYDADDTPNLNNETFDITTFGSDSINLAINYLDLTTCSELLAINIADVASGNYSIEFLQLESLVSDFQLLLVDNYTGTEIDIRNNPIYNFSVDDSDPDTFGKGRLSLKFETDIIKRDLQLQAESSVCEESFTNISILSSQSGVDYNIVINGSKSSYSAIGDGSNLSFEINSSDLSAGLNLIEVLAMKQGCSEELLSESLEITKTIINEEISYALNNAVCENEDLNISLDNSQPDVNYQIVLNGILYGSAEVGTGGSLDFTVLKDDLSGEGNQIEINAFNDVCSEVLLQSETVFRVILEPEITVADGTLVSNYVEGNQWYFNGEFIEGADSKEYVPTSTGVYTLQVSKDGCTAEVSREFTVEAVTDLSKSFENGIIIYPNPALDKVNISSESEFLERIDLINSKGQIIYSEEDKTLKFELNINQLSKGIYYIRIQNKQNVVLKRFVKE